MNKSKKKAYAGTGYFPETIKGAKELYEYLWSLTQNIENEAIRLMVHHFIAHLFNSMKAKQVKKDPATSDYETYNPDLFIPIFSRLIEREFGREFQVLDLKNKYHLIEVIGSDEMRKKSRQYKLTDEIYEKACRIESKSIRDAWDALGTKEFKKYHPVNIITGKRDRTTIKTDIYEKHDQGFKTPDIVKQAMEIISPCVFDPKYCGQLANFKEITYHLGSKVIEDRLKNEDLTEENRQALEKEKFSLQQTYLNDRLSQKTILYQQPKRIKFQNSRREPLYEYQAAYTPQVSGRLTEIGGGLQNASRVFKYNAVKHIQDVFNYDLKGSQANILIQELAKFGLPRSWITNYMNDTNAKTVHAKAIGVDESTWKKCLYSTIMGAEPKLDDSAVKNALHDYFTFKHPGKDTSVLEKSALEGFTTVASELITSCRQWRSIIIDPDKSPYLYHSRKDGFRHWINACGMKHKIYGYDRKNRLLLMENYYDHKENPEEIELRPLINSDGNNLRTRKTAEAKRKLAAFILQGQEACFIHHLTTLCHENDIKVYRNEHDGIITNKQLLDELVTEAGERSGLAGATIEIKPLASREDIKKVRAQRNKYSLN